MFRIGTSVALFPIGEELTSYHKQQILYSKLPELQPTSMYYITIQTVQQSNLQRPSTCKAYYAVPICLSEINLPPGS